MIPLLSCAKIRVHKYMHINCKVFCEHFCVTLLNEAQWSFLNILF